LQEATDGPNRMRPGAEKKQLMDVLRGIFNGRVSLAMVVPAGIKAVVKMFLHWLMTLMSPLFPPIFDALADVFGLLFAPAAAFAAQTGGAMTWVYAQWAFGLAGEGGKFGWTGSQTTVKSWFVMFVKQVVSGVLNAVVNGVMGLSMAPLKMALHAVDSGMSFIMKGLEELKKKILTPVIKLLGKDVINALAKIVKKVFDTVMAIFMPKFTMQGMLYQNLCKAVCGVDKNGKCNNSSPLGKLMNPFSIS